jgi:hypothetical protein
MIEHTIVINYRSLVGMYLINITFFSVGNNRLGAQFPVKQIL